MTTISSHKIIGNGASVQKKDWSEGEVCVWELGPRTSHSLSLLVTTKPNSVRIQVGETETKAKIMQYPCQEDEEKLKIIAKP
jgi:hypothetical protein